MKPPTPYEFRESAPTGWMHYGDRSELWWSGRRRAIVRPDAAGAAVFLDARKLWQTKTVRAASLEQGRRYAERWCAARLLPEMPLKEAVARLTSPY